MATCRFCRGWAGDLLKYAVRHYAHLRCGVQAVGAAPFLSRLTSWQLGRLPALEVERLGLTADVRALLAKLPKD